MQFYRLSVESVRVGLISSHYSYEIKNELNLTKCKINYNKVSTLN